MNNDSLTHFVRSRWFVGVIAAIGILLVAACIFEAGIFVGFHEAQFSSRWGANYANNFGAPGSPMSVNGFDSHMPDAHGAFGEIAQISSSTITITNQQKQEQKVEVDKDTIIRDHENNITAAQLSAGMYVTVVGEPTDNGEVDAKLIRVVPAPPANPSASTTPVTQ